MKSAIHRLKASIIALTLVTTPALLSLSLTSCERRETVGEKIDDALDQRPAEGVRDAAEDAKDAVKDAAKDTKDAIKDATN